MPLQGDRILLVRRVLGVVVLCVSLASALAATSPRELSTVLRDHGAVMLLIDPDSGSIVDANRAAARFYGYSIETLRAMSIQDINALGADEVAAERARARSQERDYFIFPHRLADGRIRTVEVRSSPVPLEAGGTVLFSIIRDVTERTLAPPGMQAYNARLEELVSRRSRELEQAYESRRALFFAGLVVQGGVIVLLLLVLRNRRRLQRAREREQNRLRLADNVFTHTHEGITVTDKDGNIIEVNDAFCRITGYDRSEVLGRNPRLLQSGKQGPEFYTALWHTLKSRGYWQGEIWNRRKSGELYAELLTISAIHDDAGRPLNYVGIFSDITTRLSEHERRIEHSAQHDALTGLPNRVLLADRLEHALARNRRDKEALALVALDFDDFKAVNDSHGHEVGDAVLIDVGRRLKAVLREVDTLARPGGDEFVAVLTGLRQAADYDVVLARLAQAAATPVRIGDRVVETSASLGVTICPPDDGDADTLLRHADQAMLQAKRAGKNRWHLFDPELDRQSQHHTASLQRIGKALEGEELVLFYQPKVNLRTGAVIGLEALLRWQDPERGLVPPGEFLPLVEDSHLSVDIGEWVCDAALEQLTQWRRQGLELPLSINIGALHLEQSDFAARLRRRLGAHSEVPPPSVELEILESAVLSDLDNVAALIGECRALGVRFSLDDFGTGYSSLTYLKQLAVNTLKIDRSFVGEMPWSPGDLTLVASVIQLAKAFSMDVIAEGMETADHGILLLRLGCDQAQGYGIARPMPAAAVRDWVHAWRPDPAWSAQRELPAMTGDMPLIRAEVAYRHWLRGLEAGLDTGHPPVAEADGAAVGEPAGDFRSWYENEGRERYARLAEYRAIGPSMARVRALAAEIEALHSGGRVEAARARLAAIQDAAGTLIGQMRDLSSALRRRGPRGAAFHN